jgi:hypothetical protein
MHELVEGLQKLDHLSGTAREALVGVASCSAMAGAQVEIACEGVYDLAKNAPDAIQPRRRGQGGRRQHGDRCGWDARHWVGDASRCRWRRHRAREVDAERGESADPAHGGDGTRRQSMSVRRWGLKDAADFCSSALSFAVKPQKHAAIDCDNCHRVLFIINSLQ